MKHFINTKRISYKSASILTLALIMMACDGKKSNEGRGQAPGYSGYGHSTPPPVTHVPPGTPGSPVPSDGSRSDQAKPKTGGLNFPVGQSGGTIPTARTHDFGIDDSEDGIDGDERDGDESDDEVRERRRTRRDRSTDERHGSVASDPRPTTKVTRDVREQGNQEVTTTTTTQTTVEEGVMCIRTDVAICIRAKALPTNDGCHVHHYKQPSQPITSKLDVLFVLDTSHSGLYERSEIKAGLKDFVNGLSDLDVQLAVLLGHMDSGHQGNLFSHPGGPTVLRSLPRSDNNLANKFEELIRGLPFDRRNTDRGESGMYSLNLLLQNTPRNSYLDRAKEFGFFRRDAGLLVVFVSDENDICADYPAGVTPRPDPDGTENPAKVKFCSGVTAQGIVNRLKGLKGNMPVMASGILYSRRNPPPMTPSRNDDYSDENEIGYGYLELIHKTNGVATAFDEASIKRDLIDAARRASNSLRVGRRFSSPVGSETTISVDGKALSCSIRTGVPSPEEECRRDPSTGDIYLSSGGDLGSPVDVKICPRP